MNKDVFYVTNPRVKDLYLIPYIMESYGDNVKIFTSKSDLAKGFEASNPDLIICDRSTFLLTKNQIEKVNYNCFNIHPSLLPYNRGYHPNFWSFYDQTPSGVTIHCIDCEIDSGHIIAQTEVYIDDNETLRTSYEILRSLSISLFKVVYPIINKGIDKNNLKINKKNIGKTNYKSDFNNIFDLLPNGWDTKVSYVRNLSNNFKFKRKKDFL